MNISFNLTTGEIIGWDLDVQPMIEVDPFQASSIMQNPTDYFVYPKGEGYKIVHDPKPSMYYRRDYANRQWVLDETALNYHRSNVWNNIKSYRDAKLRGGVLSGGNNFHTDDRSLTLYTSMRLRGEKLLTLGSKGTDALLRRNGQPVVWKTQDVVDGNPVFVQMTIERVITLTDDIADIEAHRYEVAEYHRVALSNSDDPLHYDYTTGWD